MSRNSKSRDGPTVEPDVMELLQMLSFCRPSGGKTELEFVARYIKPLGTEKDGYGNEWLVIGESPILWSCHTDTVHKSNGVQSVLYGNGFAWLKSGEVLGADCSAGVWLMRQMILAKVPGTYIFHADEEVGGFGSDYIASREAHRLKGIDFAIAFDRKGDRDIITHQGGKRCCSEVFAASLMGVLDPLGYVPDDSGTFTDTANYVSLVSECTNISVGYHLAHSSQEWLDVLHLTMLRDKILEADWSKLVAQRDPSVTDLKMWKRGEPIDWRDLGWSDESSLDGFSQYVKEHPEEVAAFIEALGYGQDDVEEFVYSDR